MIHHPFPPSTNSLVCAPFLVMNLTEIIEAHIKNGRPGTAHFSFIQYEVAGLNLGPETYYWRDREELFTEKSRGNISTFTSCQIANKHISRA